MSFQQKAFHCSDCNHTFEQIVGEAIIRAVCPACKKWVGLWKLATAQGISFGQFLAGVALGYVAYKALTSQ